MADIPEGRVTKLEKAAKALAAQAAVDALAQSVAAMAPMAAVSKVEGELTAMATASSMLKSYPLDGTTDASGAIAVLIDPPLLECTVTPEGPQAANKALTWNVARTVDAAGRTLKVVYAFSEISTAPISVTIALGAGSAAAVAKAAGAGVKCRFRVTGKVQS